MRRIDLGFEEWLRGREAMIVPPKEPPIQVLLRLPPTLVAEMDALAERTNRSRNETAELLLGWAVERAKLELDVAEKAKPAEKPKPKK
jgi:hypothetical protein